MNVYTVIGFWLDSDQRFASVVTASSAAEAESSCIREHSGLGICGVLAGALSCLDTSPLVAYSGDEISSN